MLTELQLDRELRDGEGGRDGLGVPVLEAARREADDGAVPHVQGGGVAVRRGGLLGGGRPQPHPPVRHIQPQAEAGVLFQESLTPIVESSKQKRFRKSMRIYLKLL